MGSYAFGSGPDRLLMVLYAAVKMPLLVLVTSVLCLPAFFVLTTVLGLRDDHRVAVLEIGMNHPGETGWLSGIARPTIALINNAQREHQEFMNSVADVAAEHAAILNALPEKGTAVVNADDDFAGFWRQVVDRRNAEGAHLAVRDFGLLAPAVVTGKYRSGASATTR